MKLPNMAGFLFWFCNHLNLNCASLQPLMVTCPYYGLPLIPSWTLLTVMKKILFSA